ncbi:DUF7344 domain-containing protein [Halorussus halophilus]|uniref:DUF7344 domain-containing protein n=1 Tax=Halorussus halophilus TaxID=2650975 RepID=UPI00130145F0|nr:ArsR family transcriptional regulator [Halorussus halophilus]
MSNQTQSEGGRTRYGGETTFDPLLKALCKSPRRQLLTALADVDSDDEKLTPSDFCTPTAPDGQVPISLHHTHLPHLEDAGFIEWNRETNYIRRGPRYDEIAPLVELLRTHEGELPADWP